jgi:hypothetical protein
VVEGEDPPLGRPDYLAFGAAHARGRHLMQELN